MASSAYASMDLTAPMFDALRNFSDRRCATAHEVGSNGLTLKVLAERGFLLADEGTPPIYSATPMGLGAIAVLCSPPVPKDNEGMVARIQRTVAGYYGIPLIEMTSQRRARVVARPRQIAMYLARELTQFSLPAIGRRFGDRDHTTVMHAIRHISFLEEYDPQIGEDVSNLLSELRA